MYCFEESNCIQSCVLPDDLNLLNPTLLKDGSLIGTFMNEVPFHTEIVFVATARSKEMNSHEVLFHITSFIHLLNLDSYIVEVAGNVLLLGMIKEQVSNVVYHCSDEMEIEILLNEKCLVFTRHLVY